MKIHDFSLYLITDRHQTGGRQLTEIVHQALDGGVKAVQLREKDISSAELYRLALEMRRLTADFNARLIINDRPDVALAVDADGVHIGAGSIPIAAARRVIGRDKLICYSAHSFDEALSAQAEGADYVTFSPVYFISSKADYGEPCGVNKLSKVATAMTVPVIALGGISLTNITETLSAHIQGISVISAILAADDPRVAASSLLKKIEEYAQHP